MWVESCFALAWTAHGGSGLHISWSEVLDLDIPLRDRLLERIGQQRRTEAAALRGHRG